MSKREEALTAWEKTKQREQYWQQIFEKMREESKKVAKT